MDKKPSYEEQEKRVKELEDEAIDRKKSEGALMGSEESFRNLFSSCPMGIHIYKLETDGSLKFQNANQAADNILGVSCHQFIGKTIEEAFPPLSDTEVPARYRDAASKGEMWETEQITYTHGDITGAFKVVAFQTNPNEMASIFEDITKRKQAEEALRESEAKYRKLLDLSPDPIAIVQEKRHVFINATYTNLFGYTMQDIEKGLSLSQVVSEKDREIVARRMTERLAGKELGSEYIVVDLVAKGGEIIPCEISGNLIDFGDRPATLVIIRDITERRRAEEALRQSEERFRSLVELASDWIWEVDQNGVFTYADPKVKDFLGYEPEEVVGKPYNYFMTEDSKKRLALSFKDQEEKPRHFSRRNHIQLHKDGREIMIEARGLPIFDMDGKMEGWRGIDTDITERKRAEDALRESKQFLSAVFDSIQDGISVLDPELNIVRVNQAMQEWFGHMLPLEGRKCYEAYIGRTKACTNCPTLRALDSGRLEMEEIPLPRAKGVTGTVELFSFPMLDDSGKPAGVVEYVRDITKRKRAERHSRKVLKK